MWRAAPRQLALTREAHHKQRMSLAAVKNDAMAIRKRLLAKKQRLCTAAPSVGRLKPNVVGPTWLRSSGFP